MLRVRANSKLHPQRNNERFRRLSASLATFEDSQNLVWSNYEKSTLEDVKEQLVNYGQDDPALSEWLALMVSDAGPIVDLLKLAKEHYFPPAMRGSLSIKDVLPAVWLNDPALQSHRLLDLFVNNLLELAKINILCRDARREKQ
jgi:hypothetical protein